MRLTVVAVVSITLTFTIARAEPLDHFNEKDDIGNNKVPHLGESHVLVVPTRVGTATFPADRLAHLQMIFNPEGGPGTFRDYWRTVSNGRYDPIPTLAAPVLYPDSCPIPGETVKTCKITIDDLPTITSGGIKTTLESILGRVRDEQNIDLAQFDVNTGMGAGQDGYFDGLILDSDIINGVGVPLDRLNNSAVLAVHPGGTGPMITAGLVAMVPPEFHEYGHNLGFVDLYYGPPVNCLMADIKGTIGAFSRQQIGWGEVKTVKTTETVKLQPVLDGGQILRINPTSVPEGKPMLQYLLIENRGGVHHADLESWPAGINIYTIDETKLPEGAFGFLDIGNRTLYYPNKAAPHLFVNWPVMCDDTTTDQENSCVLAGQGITRTLTMQDGTAAGFTLRIGQKYDDGSIDVTIDDGTSPIGCAVGGSPSTAALCLIAVYLVARRSQCHRQTSASVVVGAKSR